MCFSLNKFSVMIRVAIVDDKATNRRIVGEKLSGNDFFNIVFQAYDGEDFLEQMKKIDVDMQPHIVLMDLEMPNVNGITAIATASSLYPHIKFVVLSIFDDEEKIFNAIKAGACGYLLKEESGAVITEMLMSLWESGAGPISPSIAYKILQMVQSPVVAGKKNKESAEIFNLSDREQEILQLLSKGFEYKDIGNQLFISANTVKKHCINIYQKLHVNSRAQALRIAYSKGLI